MGDTNPFTALIPRLAGVDPDDAFSVVPYEKGSTFLWYLEDLVGGGSVFEPFLKSYYAKFAYKSIDSFQFKDYFLEYFKDEDKVKSIDWETWLHTPGMPIYKPSFDDSLAKSCRELAAAWQALDLAPEAITPETFQQNFNEFSTDQKTEFFWALLSGPTLPHSKLEAMRSLYKLDTCKNVEIEFKWIRLGLAARWDEAVAPALRLVSVQGRMKFVRPLYRDLYGWEEKRLLAVETFLATKDQMMHASADILAKDLHINQ